eukprot:g54701.t1
MQSKSCAWRWDLCKYQQRKLYSKILSNNTNHGERWHTTPNCELFRCKQDSCTFPPYLWKIPGNQPLCVPVPGNQRSDMLDMSQTGQDRRFQLIQM